MKIKDIVAPLERFAPLSFQEEYDNSGLVVGRPEADVASALVCVDVTEAVLDEAEKLGAGLVISHHPIIFHPLKRLNSESYVERAVERAIKQNIALYACHTNLDSTHGGMSYRLAELLGIEKPETLAPETGAIGANEASENQTAEHGLGVIGTLAKPLGALEFLKTVQQKLDAKAVRHSEIPAGEIQRVALCTGSGGSLIGAAKAAGTELYITSDLKYNDFLAAGGAPTTAGEKKFIVADVGHFESEFCAIGLIHDVISKTFANFAIHKSCSSKNPVGYLI